jgi:LuxR family transcriptional regulator, quorum-sensing system regulator CviR
MNQTNRETLQDVRLTEREIEILNWIKQGKTNVETALILEISNETVKFHLNNIKRKLDCVRTMQAVVKAIGCGLIDP